MRRGPFLLVLSAALAALLGVMSALPASAQQRRPPTSCGGLSSPDETIRLCTDIINRGRERGPSLGATYSNRCWAWGEKGEYDKALADCDQAITLDPKNHNALNNRGYAKLNKNQYDEAIPDFDQAIRIEPKKHFSYGGRGMAWQGKGELDRAIADFDQAIRLKPDYVAVINRRGNAWYSKANYDRAIADYDAAIRVDPSRSVYFTNRGNSLVAKRDIEAALIDYGQALRLDPKSDYAYRMRGDAYVSKGDLPKAMADYDEALRNNAKNAEAYNGRGNVWFNQGDFDRAIADYDQAVRLLPHYASALGSRAAAWLIKGNADRALVDASEAMRYDPKNAASYNNRGTAFRMKGEYDRALTDLDTAIRMEPRIARYHYNRGLVWAAKGDMSRAITDYDEALRLDSGFSAALVQRGEAHEKRGDIERARSDFRSAVSGAPKFYDGRRSQEVAQQRLAALAAPAPTPTPPPLQDVSSATKPVAVDEGPRVALVIGNSAYQAVSALPNPRSDAAAVATALREVGFQTVLLEQDVTREKLIDALRRFANASERASWAVIYFAGHGIEIGGVNYLIPIDAKLETDRDPQFEAVALDQALGAVEGAKRLRLVILDACRDNPFMRKIRRTIASRSIGRGLARVEPEGGTLVAYAAKHGEVALDGDGANSPFVSAFVRHVRTPGMEINKLFRVVRDDVMAATGRKQEPFVYGSLPGDDFFFVAAR